MSFWGLRPLDPHQALPWGLMAAPIPPATLSMHFVLGLATPLAKLGASESEIKTILN